MKEDKGFTLIEVVLVILLVGLIAGFIGGILLQETKLYSLIIPRKEARVENKLVFERLIKELKDAYKGSYNTGSNVRFKIPYSLYKNYTSVNIYQSANKLYFTGDNKPSQVFAENVSFFNVTSVRWQPKRDLVKVTLLMNSQGGVIQQETTIYLRNSR